MKTYIKRIDIDKPIKKKINIETILLILFLIIIFTIPLIINQKKELPDGTLMSRNRITGQIGIKMPNNEFTYFQTDSPFYKDILAIFNNLGGSMQSGGGGGAGAFSNSINNSKTK